jgi:CMP-N-acetylneuraminic acid synthetase
MNSQDFTTYPLFTIIPARGGSKGIKLKNLETINGVTLVQRAVLAAKSVIGNKIYISSDNLAILESGKSAGAIPIVRPKELATDVSSSESVALHMLTTQGIDSGCLLLLQPTSPFVDTFAIKNAYETLKQNRSNVQSLFSSIEGNHFLWQEKSLDNWEPTNHMKNKRLMRQESPRKVLESGSFYIMDIETFRNTGTRFCGNTFPAISKEWSNIDIDTIENLKLARLLSAEIDPLLEYNQELIRMREINELV